MSNIYAAPQSEVTLVTEQETAQHYVVSEKKFLILFITTLGMYGVYWFWRHWNMYKIRTGEGLWPWARALFSVFFTHKLFNSFSNGSIEETDEPSPSISKFATIYVLLAITDSMLSNM